MKRILVLTIFVFTINAFLIHSQTPPVPGKPAATAKVNVALKGQVVDSLTQESIPYVTLKITETGDPAKVVKLLSTDVDGKFNVTLNASGKFDLLINSVGKVPMTKPFEVTGTEKTVDLAKLMLSDNNTLNEVVVTALKPLVAVDLDKITYSMQDDPDSKTSTVLDMMRKVPMITVDGEDKIQLKGSSSYKIYLDGKPSNMISSNPTQVLRSMPASMVKSVEVITDPGAKYDAEGVTGVINIITNKQPMGGYTASLGAGLDNRGGYNGNTYVTAKYGKFGITGNYGIDRYKVPESGYNTYREIYNPTSSASEKYLNQKGTNKYEGIFQMGSAELSYELDTANLISASFNRVGIKNETTGNLDVKALFEDKIAAYSYNQRSKTEAEQGSTSFNVDYQRTFSKKDELLTVSYRLNLTPNDSWSESRIEAPVNYYNRWQEINNDASDREHTFQIDYTTPFAKIHSLEAGVKYIIRLNESNTDINYFDENKNSLAGMTSISEFKYRYDILAGYLGYNLRYKDYGFKAGLRLEDTNIEAEYPLKKEQNFDNHYYTLVPSATLTFRYKMIHTFRFGYNMRIQRPGIYHLNPYLNNSDPRYITQGNPNLDVEKGHSLNLNYGVFKPKVYLSAMLGYTFMNNSIQSITDIRNDGVNTVSYTTYENIGKQQRIGTNLYFRYTPTPKLEFTTNVSAGYIDIRTNNDMNLKNSGFAGFAYGIIQYTFPKDFRFSINGGGGTQGVSLQGESSNYYFHSLNLSKAFLNKKLNVTATASSPFSKYRTITSKNNNDPTFYSETTIKANIQTFGIRVSYQFGELKQQAVKKTARGISNDDMKAGESNSGTGGVQQGGTLQQ